jgi:hypothetical protein
MTVDELREQLFDTLTQLARDVYNSETEIKRLRRHRNDLTLELERQRGALAALDMLDTDEDETS